ncbi:MAG: efflux RND transporter periplasmic adaptor subunit [Gemmataceae bacterium]|nr:efflux RND transporter periplasmic adaptor subunit [Gemmataceae bacterium]
MNASNGQTEAEVEGKRLSLSDRVQALKLPESAKQVGPPSALAWVALAVGVVAFISSGVLAWEAYRTRQLLAGLADGPTRDLLEKLARGEAAAAGEAKNVPASAISAANRAPAEGEVVLESKGYIVPVHQIQVSPKVGGMVMELNFEEGMRVQEGYVLARLETTDYQADYDRAVGMALAAKHRWQELWKYRDDEIRQAQAELEDAIAQRDQLALEWQRTQALRATKALAPRDYEAAESAYKSMAQRVIRLQLALDLWKKGPRDERIAAAKGEYDQAQAEVAKAKWRLDNCVVRAPVSGTILSKKAEKGNIVNPSAFSNGLSASICEMADLSDLEVDLAIAERDVARIFKGQRCTVKAEAYPERNYQGVVSRLMPTADRSKGAVPVRVKIAIPREEEGQYLRPEMGAVVTFYNQR